jgi:gas vesicle protein
MSERGGGGGGVGPFIFGIAIGAALGYLFAPAPGAESRRKLAGRLRDLKEFAGEEVDELKTLVAESAADAEPDDEAGDATDDEDARDELERRVAAARRRRRERRKEEDEPVA